MSEITYYCACGCANNEDEMTVVRHLCVNRMVCKKHPAVMQGEIIKRSIVCMDCSKIVFIKSTSRPPKRCPACIKEKEKTYHYKKTQKITQKNLQERESFKKTGKIKLTKQNFNNCIRFKELCQECINPFFQCKLFSKTG